MQPEIRTPAAAYYLLDFQRRGDTLPVEYPSPAFPGTIPSGGAMTHSMKRKRYITLILSAALSCASLNDAVLRDLPQDREYTVTVMRVNDPRLPRLTDAQFSDMLSRLRGYIREHLGYRVRFIDKGEKDLLSFRKEMEFINALPMMKEVRASLLDPAKKEDMEKLKKFIREMVARTEETVLEMQVPGYGRFKTREEAADRLFREYADKIKRINAIRTGDGTPLAHPRYAETLTYPFWDLVLRNIKEADFIFSNTIMADAELDIPIYVVLRYGITTGLVEENRFNSFGGAGIIFTYPFLARDPFFAKERVEGIPPEDMTDVLALYSAHEFGHFFNRYKDYYDHKNCMMVPAHNLNYYRWYLERKYGRCPLVHEKLKHF